MQPILLATKTYIPPLSADQVPRTRLTARLDSTLAEGKRLALVCAPAGYGKTTLLSDWVRAGTHPPDTRFCWLSLEAADSDPAQFLLYLAAALRPALGEAGEVIWAAVNTPQPPRLQAALPGLVNALASAEGRVVLVLDDYQVISNAEVQAGMGFLLDHLPGTARVILATRSDPPLPLHRYRARGEMVEVRMDELRFTADETGRFVNSATGMELDAEDGAALETRTEGWIAGLRLATLSLQGKTDPGAFIQSLSGSHRYILDYLTEEALTNQTEATQRFLLRTAVLGRMCAPLCAAVTGQAEAEDILADLERKNLFLVPLDDERRWYRYHHLFSDLLMVRLRQAAQTQPGLLEDLHRRAAGWLESNGWIRPAIEHLIAAGEFEAAAGLVETHTMAFFASGHLNELLSWIRLLPPELAAKRPWLAVHQSWALVFAGAVERIEPLLRQAERVMESGAPGEAERQRLRADMNAIRAMAAFTAGDIPTALRYAGPAEAEFPPESLFARSVMVWVQGFAARIQGNLPAAMRAFEEVLAIGHLLNNIWTVATASVDLGTVLRESGRLRAAEQVYRRGLQEVEQAGASGVGYVGRLESFLASVLHERNDLEAAADLAEAAIRHNRLWDNPNHTMHAYLVAARVAYSRGDLDGMERALSAAGDKANEAGVLPTLRASGAALRARLLLARGQVKEAERLFGAPQLPPGTPNLLREILLTSAARVKLAAGQKLPARALLSEVETPARAEGRTGQLIEVLTLQALAAPGPAEAAAALDEALALGLPEGYARTFLDEGAALAATGGLAGAPARLAGRGPEFAALAALAAQAEALLTGFAPAGTESRQRASAPLTGREVEILRAMAEGLGNAEIGRRLFISAGTVKAHSAAIYRKLDAANRAEAVARAKDLGLL